MPGQTPFSTPHSIPPTNTPPPKWVAAIVNETTITGRLLPATKKSEAVLTLLDRM